MSKNLLIAFAKPILLKYYFVFRFHPPPEKIELILDGEMKELFPELSGTFVQGEGLVNQNPYWIQQNGTSAIWYHSFFRDWIVGNEVNLGDFWGNIYALSDQNTVANGSKYAPKWIDEENVNFKVIGKLHTFCILKYHGSFCYLQLII